jgi:hypothetical protein
MKKIIFLMFGLLLLVGMSGCLPTKPKSQLPNPASVKCEKNGGTIEIIDSKEGQWGLCTFKDGSICAQWAYYYGECEKGQCFKECRYEDTAKEGIYNSCTGRLIKLGKCEEPLTGVKGHIPNPASEKCIENGGSLEIHEGPKGEWGLCTFKDGSICEEWDYYNGECKKGECFKVCKNINTFNEGWYNSCTGNVIEYTICSDTTDLEMPNPASVKCIEDGGSLVTFKDPNGDQTSICIFKDGSFCYQWDYYNGDCDKGECYRKCKFPGTDSEGWYNSCTGDLMQYTDCSDFPSMPNPASIQCIENKGTLETYESPEGEWNLCVFPDESICEEWKYYYGECSKGECFKECRNIGTYSEGWYNSCNGNLIEFTICSKEEEKKEESKPLKGISDNAAKKCEYNNGKIMTLGNYEICVYADNTFCKLSALDNDTCNPGDCKILCKKVGSKSEGWYDCNGNLIAYDMCKGMEYPMENTEKVEKCVNAQNYKKLEFTDWPSDEAICVYQDNSICNLTEFYNNECKPGQCWKECKFIGTRSEGWYNSCNGNLIEYTFCSNER